MTIQKDWGYLDVVQLKNPAATTATFTQTTGTDLSKYRKASILLSAGAWTDGTHTPKIQTSATVGGTYADDTAVLDSWTAIGAAGQQNQVYKVDIDVDALANRFLKLVVTVAGATTGAVYGAVLVGELKKGA